MVNIPPTFIAGTPVELSGIYRVFHDRNHYVVVDVLCIAGEVFPECGECGRKAKFTLQRDIPHIRECALFESTPQAPTKS
jgi:hypothetical protein